MPTWSWFAIAVGTGALVGLELWSWLRHGISAVALAAAGLFALFQGAVVLMIVGGLALGVTTGVTGWDPVGLNESDGAALDGTGNCEPSYPDVCLDPDASDYDCEHGNGDGPRYVSGPITVTGSDPFDLDRDGNGIGCE